MKAEVTGTEHPKAVTLRVTYDELVDMRDVLNEVDASADDPLRQALDAHTTDGDVNVIVIPGGLVSEMEELWGDEPAICDVMDKLREEAMDELGGA